MAIDQITERTIHYHMDRIKELFKDCEITVYIHNKGFADGDLISSSEQSYKEMHERMGKFIQDKDIK